MIGIDHLRECPGVVAYLRHVHYPGDIDAAMADKDPDAGLLAGNIAFQRIFRLGQQSAPSPAQERGRSPRRRRGLAHGLGDVLGGLKDPAREDPGAAGLDHLKGRTFHEAPGIGGDPADLRQLPGGRMRVQTHREHDQVKFFRLDAPVFANVVHLRLRVRGSWVTREIMDCG